jgi:hypothetical protein
VAEDCREQTFRIGARQGEFVGVADAGRPDLDQDLEGFRAFELNRGDFKRLGGLKGDRGADIHGFSPFFNSCLAPATRSSDRSTPRLPGS